VVVTGEYRHTSLIATLRRVWNLGSPFSGRDAVARTFDDVLALAVPREPDAWPDVPARPVPAFQMERVAAGAAIGVMGRHLCHGLLHHARESGMTVPPAPFDPDAEISPAVALDCVHWIAERMFPLLS